jgi:hypothetical protein
LNDDDFFSHILGSCSDAEWNTLVAYLRRTTVEGSTKVPAKFSNNLFDKAYLSGLPNESTTEMGLDDKRQVLVGDAHSPFLNVSDFDGSKEERYVHGNISFIPANSDFLVV